MKPDIAKSVQMFHTQMESLLPLRHFSEFHEESTIKSMAQSVRTSLIEEFMKKSPSGPRCDLRITDMLKELLSQIKNLVDQYLQKNMEHRQKTESVMGTFIEAICLMYRTDSEAELKMNPEMEKETQEAVFGMGKLDAIRRLKGRWQARCPDEFYDEQMKKLEMKLDIIKAEISGKHASLGDEACVISKSNLSEESGDSTPVKSSGNVGFGSDSKGDDLSKKCDQYGDVEMASSEEGVSNISDSNLEESGVPTAVKSSGTSESKTGGDCRSDVGDKDDNLRKKPYECEYCEEGFSSKTLYEHHLKKTHIPKEIFACQECNRKFNTPQKLREHSQLHQRVYDCSHCSKPFTESNNYRRHMLTHSGERPYECPNCEDKFLRKDRLVPHLVVKHNLTEDDAKELAKEAALEYVKREMEDEDIDKIDVKTIDSRITDIVLKKAGLMLSAPRLSSRTRRCSRSGSESSAPAKKHRANDFL